MKVFGVNLDGTNQGIVATTSQKKAAALFGVSLYHFQQYGGVAGNASDVELAMREPGVAWTKRMLSNDEFRRMP